MKNLRSPTSVPPPAPARTDLIDPKWAWHYQTLLTLREKLLQARAEHEKAATSPTELHSVDLVDTAQDQIEHQVILAELHSESDRLVEIDAALKRLRDGNYGVCEETGVPIAEARLRAIPWTRFSRSAAEMAEKRAGQSAPRGQTPRTQ